jgi:hypothetical protein
MFEKEVIDKCDRLLNALSDLGPEHTLVRKIELYKGYKEHIPKLQSMLRKQEEKANKLQNEISETGLCIHLL